MGDSHHTLLRPVFNGSLRIEGRPDRLTRFAGTPLLRELDERLGVTSGLAAQLEDPRELHRVQHSQTSLLRSWIYTMAVHRSTETATSDLRFDPALRLAAADGRGLAPLDDDQGLLASQPTFSRLLGALSSPKNLGVLEDAVFDSTARAVHAMNGGKKLEPITLDIDSFPHPVCGHQDGAEYNKHYGGRVFHPLGVMLGETGHWLGLKLRPGNVHTADGATDMLLKLVDKTQAEIADVADVRGDAGFVAGDLLNTLDKRGIRFAFRLPRNGKVLKKLAEDHNRRPPGRPPQEPRTWCEEVDYQAGTWDKSYRVVLVSHERPGELFLHTFFIVTNYPTRVLDSGQVYDHYRERGTMETHIGEHQSVVEGFLSSSNRPKTTINNHPVQKRSKPIDAQAANAAALCLHGLAYNLLNTLRLLAGESGKLMAIYEPSKLHLRRARERLSTARDKRPRRGVGQASDADCVGEDGRDLGPFMEGAASTHASPRSLLINDNSTKARKPNWGERGRSTCRALEIARWDLGRLILGAARSW